MNNRQWAVKVDEWDSFVAQLHARQKAGYGTLLIVVLGTLTGFASSIVGLALVSLVQEVAAQRGYDHEDSHRP